MTRDRVAEFFSEKTPKTLLALTGFLGLIVVFKKLLVLLAFFVVFERGLFFSAGFLARRFKWSRMAAFGAVAGGTVIVLTLLLWLSAGRLAQVVTETRETLPNRIAAFKESALYLELKPHLPDSEKVVESAQHYGSEVAKSAAEAGHLVLMALIGLVLAIVYYFDEEKLRVFLGTLEPSSFTGTIARWLGHLADAVSLTVQLQLIVAACNTVFTLPVLLLIGVPHVPALMLLIFLTSLIPVVGNLISGAVLILMAYQVKGVPGVAIFVVLTFLLHKVEAYYLNPRLTARHVQLPGFVLILSLIGWEHLLGFVGLFVSFPFLYIAGKLRQELFGAGPGAGTGAATPSPTATTVPLKPAEQAALAAEATPKP